MTLSNLSRLCSLWVIAGLAWAPLTGCLGSADKADDGDDDEDEDDDDDDGFTDDEDCNDENAAINPDAPELCNGEDDDCDGETDPASSEDALTTYPDDDGDGYGDEDRGETSCDPDPDHVELGGDCDDDDRSIHPDATERCNDQDDDCDGEVDPGSSTDADRYYLDRDGDGWGDPDTAYDACYRVAGSTEFGSDCDDTNSDVSPSESERCNGLDDDCDGEIDPPDSEDAVNVYIDTDGDGYGDPFTRTTACEPGPGTTSIGDDCDDTNAEISPDAEERCNGVDDDCNGGVDPDDALDVLTWYVDMDGDNFGGSVTTLGCDQPAGFVADNTDCDDLDDTSWPGAAEVCDNADNDCDSVVDPDTAIDAAIWYADLDADGYGQPTLTTYACDVPPGYVGSLDDCDDTSADANPGALERCDGVDNDCDAVVDEADAIDAPTWYEDLDGDGYGGSGSAFVACEASTAVSTGTDCDDSDAARSPVATELCWNGVDDDCDGLDESDTNCAPTGSSATRVDTLAGTSALGIIEGVAVVGDLFSTGHDVIAVGLSTDEIWMFNEGRLGSRSTADLVISGSGIGASVAGVGDLTGDGVPEIVFGAPELGLNGADSGAVYLYSWSGSDTASTADVFLTLAGPNGDFAAE